MEAEMVPSDEKADYMLQQYDLFLVHYNHIATLSMHRGDLLFNMTTKFHEVWHVVYFGRFLNPRMMWCYSFEDFIGKIKKAAQSCVAATKMHNIPGKLMGNYILALSIELRKWT